MPRARELQKSVISAPPLLSVIVSKCTPIQSIRQVVLCQNEIPTRSGCVGGGYRPRLATSPPFSRGLGTASRLAETARNAPALITLTHAKQFACSYTNKKTALRQFLLVEVEGNEPSSKEGLVSIATLSSVFRGLSTTVRITQDNAVPIS